MNSEGFESELNRFESEDYVCVGLEIGTPPATFRKWDLDKKISMMNDKMDDYWLDPSEIKHLRLSEGASHRRALHVWFDVEDETDKLAELQEKLDD